MEQFYDEDVSDALRGLVEQGLPAESAGKGDHRAGVLPGRADSQEEALARGFLCGLAIACRGRPIGGPLFFSLAAFCWRAVPEARPPSKARPASRWPSPWPLPSKRPCPRRSMSCFPKVWGNRTFSRPAARATPSVAAAIGQRTEARWDNLKEDHRDKVASLNEQELETTFAYLKEHFSEGKPEPKVPPQFLEGGCTPF